MIVMRASLLPSGATLIRADSRLRWAPVAFRQMGNQYRQAGRDPAAGILNSISISVDRRVRKRPPVTLTDPQRYDWL